jgi:dTDP-glucose 4,6-dehydratase
MSETHRLNPLSPCPSAKAGADGLMYPYLTARGTPAVIVRPFHSRRPVHDLEKAAPRFVSSAQDGRPTTVDGDGSAMRDLFHIHDSVAALACLLDHDPPSGVREVSTSEQGARRTRSRTPRQRAWRT